MFNFTAYTVVVAIVAAGLWFIIGLARLTHAWRDSQRRTAGLRQRKADGAKQLLQSVEELATLSGELREGKFRVETLNTALEARKKHLASVAPPQPPAIYVSSEFPPSSRDRAWTALLRRISPNKNKRSDEPTERYVLVWAQDHAAAQSRAQQAVAGHPGYTVEGVMKYG